LPLLDVVGVYYFPFTLKQFELLISTIDVQSMKVKGNIRSVMPLDVLGHTRVTMVKFKGFWKTLYSSNIVKLFSSA